MTLLGPQCILHTRWRSF